MLNCQRVRTFLLYARVRLPLQQHGTSVVYTGPRVRSTFDDDAQVHASIAYACYTLVITAVPLV